MYSPFNSQYPKLENFCLFLTTIIAILLFYINPMAYGDIFRFLIVFIGIILLLQRKISHIIRLCIAAGFVLAIAFVLKQGLAMLAQHVHADYFAFCKRPINAELDGFPSGHSTAAFVALGFVCYYESRGFLFASYPLKCVGLLCNKWILSILLLAILVALSRVMTLWHTPLQVICGAFLGFVGTYIVIGVIDSKTR